MPPPASDHSREHLKLPVVAGVSPASFWLRGRLGCHYKWPGSPIPATTTKSHLVNTDRCRHGGLFAKAFGAVRRPTASASTMQTPHRGVATTFLRLFLVLWPAFGAFAQDITATPQPGSEPVATTFEVIVTGSNIPTSEEVGPQPVDTYRRSDIFRLGARSATEFVQKLPVVNGPSINDSINVFGDGRTEVDLRGLFLEKPWCCRTAVVWRLTALRAMTLAAISLSLLRWTSTCFHSG